MEWIRPVLRVLGHCFAVQVPLKTPLGRRIPDYLFYADEAAKLAVKGEVLTEQALGGAVAVGDAKAWGRSLDQGSVKAGQQISQNPSLQIDFYIRYTGLAWGLLTNGRLWRLYHHETAKKLDVYYEVDLPALLEQGEEELFNFFYLFFRREAFVSGWLGSILSESRIYAQGVSHNLQGQVYEALRQVAQGFLDFPRNGLTPTPERLKAIYDNSLILLYRLLFTFYAESRHLLPVGENEAYTRRYSLYALMRQVARDLELGMPAVPSMSGLWGQLRQLWQVLDMGNADLDVPAYNGGLFNPAKHPFLEQFEVGDLHLRHAIDLLARTDEPATGRREFVDYRDLEVRHLGSIYEGLLEYQLRLAPTSSRGVELLTDKGERKATGSYYTPDYIVQYMVEQTIEPLLRALSERISDTNELVQAILGLKVLDPAMGSGHFLVAATDFIARYLTEIISYAKDDSILSLSLANEMGQETPRAGSESEMAYWRRRVVQSCIYGVDLNPLAVELAKLSLWLATVARDKPLSFLDHHLRCGNSLVGAEVARLMLDAVPSKKRRRRKRRKQESAQLSLLSDEMFAATIRDATSFMGQIAALTSDTLLEVRTAEQIYTQQARQATAASRHLADVWTARHFGLTVDESLWQGLSDYVLQRGFEVPQYAHIIKKAQAIATQHRFFHWELEFPEVFFNAQGQLKQQSGGFDAVIGNPPYVRQEALKPFKGFFQARFNSFHGVADLYIYFFEQGIKRLHQKGRMAYISSGTFARANFAKPFRAWFPSHAQFDTLVDFGENQPFEGAEMVRPSIVVLSKGQAQATFRTLFMAGTTIPDSLSAAISKEGFDCESKTLNRPEWTFQPRSQTRLFDKIMAQGTPLIDVVEGNIYYGIKTGLNEAFLIDQSRRDELIKASPASQAILKPLLRGADLRPWYQKDEGRWLIRIPTGWTSEKFGSGLSEQKAWQKFSQLHAGLAKYLEPFAKRGRKRHDQGQYWWELRSCDYYAEFDLPKIFWADIAKVPRFSWDEQKKYVNNKGYIIPNPHPSLLGVLQSRVLWFATSQLCQPLRLRAGLWQYQMFTQFTSRFPIPDMPDNERETIGQLALTISQDAQARYKLHHKTRHRIGSDLGTPNKKLNQKLTAWWTLDFSTFRKQIKKVFKQGIRLSERDEWEEWLAGRQAKHEQLTRAIIQLEKELNRHIYTLFDLTPTEIQLIEESTKYKYGEV
jgi:type I restriction-modification system DNA methylase subunit